MNKLNAIYVSIVSFVVAVAALVMCIVCGNCKKDEAPVKVDAESVKAILAENPEMVLEALQKGEAKRQEEMRLAAQKLISENIDEINNAEYSPVLGNPEGKITIVEFFDFACGYCHKLAPVLDSIISKNKDVRVVLKPMHFLSPASQYSAKAQYAAAEQGRAKEFYMGVMNANGPLSEAKIDEIAVKAGLDLEKMKADMASEKVTKAMSATNTLATKIQVRSVPTLVIEGERVQTLSERDIQNKIDAAKK